MSGITAVIFGANGSLGSIIISHLLAMGDVRIINCGSKQYDLNVEFYPWRFGQESPIPKIVANCPEAERVIVFYSAIYWPSSDAELKLNLDAFREIVHSLPENLEFISVSSFVVTTKSVSFYAKLKRAQESVCLEHQLTSLRLGMILSEKPFGQSMMFISLAKAFYLVPVPFYDAKIIISREVDIQNFLFAIVSGRKELTNYTTEVRSAEMSFIEVVSQVVNQAGLKYKCIPIPNFIANGIFNIVIRVAPSSWLAQRLQGLKAFASS